MRGEGDALVEERRSDVSELGRCETDVGESVFVAIGDNFVEDLVTGERLGRRRVFDLHRAWRSFGLYCGRG